MASETRRRITYSGGAIEPHALVSMLRGEDVTVEWQPPEERRDLAGALQDYVVAILATGTVVAINVAVGRFRERARGTVKVEDDEDHRD